MVQSQSAVMHLAETKTSAGPKRKRRLPRPVKWGLLTVAFALVACIGFVAGLTLRELANVPAEIPDYREEFAAVLAPADNPETINDMPTSTTLVADAAAPKYLPIALKTADMSPEIVAMCDDLNRRFDSYRDLIAAYETEKASLPINTRTQRFLELERHFYETSRELGRIDMLLNTATQVLIGTEFSQNYVSRISPIEEWRKRAVAEMLAAAGDPYRAAIQTQWNHAVNWSVWIQKQQNANPRFLIQPTDEAESILEDYRRRVSSKEWQTELYYLRQAGFRGYGRTAIRVLEHATANSRFQVNLLSITPEQTHLSDEPWFYIPNKK